MGWRKIFFHLQLVLKLNNKLYKNQKIHSIDIEKHYLSYLHKYNHHIILFYIFFFIGDSLLTKVCKTQIGLYNETQKYDAVILKWLVFIWDVHSTYKTEFFVINAKPEEIQKGWRNLSQNHSSSHQKHLSLNLLKGG